MADNFKEIERETERNRERERDRDRERDRERENLQTYRKVGEVRAAK